MRRHSTGNKVLNDFSLIRRHLREEENVCKASRRRRPTWENIANEVALGIPFSTIPISLIRCITFSRLVTVTNRRRPRIYSRTIRRPITFSCIIRRRRRTSSTMRPTGVSIPAMS